MFQVNKNCKGTRTLKKNIILSNKRFMAARCPHLPYLSRNAFTLLPKLLYLRTLPSQWLDLTN
jgi:hypothetical protein